MIKYNIGVDVTNDFPFVPLSRDTFIFLLLLIIIKLVLLSCLLPGQLSYKSWKNGLGPGPKCDNENESFQCCKTEGQKVNEKEQFHRSKGRRPMTMLKRVEVPKVIMLKK